MSNVLNIVMMALIFSVVFLFFVVLFSFLLYKIHNYLHPLDVKDIQVWSGFPYDLVTFVDEKEISHKDELKGLYNIGIIVGILGKAGEKSPTKFKVLRFNMDRLDKPFIKTYHISELRLLDSPLKYLAVATGTFPGTPGMVSSASDFTQGVMDAIQESEDFDLIEDLDSASSKSKKKIVH